MNFCFGVGVLIGEVIKKENYYFKIATIDDVTGEGVYVNCMATPLVGFPISTKCKEGTPIIYRGHLGFNKPKNANYVIISYVKILLNAFGKEIQMGIEEFLDIYKPGDAVLETKKLMKQQEKAEKLAKEKPCKEQQVKKEEEICSDMVWSVDMS